MKIRPVGAELFCARRRADVQMDRQAGMTKLIAVFRSFANAPEKPPSKLRHKSCLLATSLFLLSAGKAVSVSKRDS